jgi:hypothetical protein
MVEQIVESSQQPPVFTDIFIGEIDLGSYDCLLESVEVSSV